MTFDLRNPRFLPPALALAAIAGCTSSVSGGGEGGSGGRITPDDPGFASLLVWSDGYGNRRSSAGELRPASAGGLTSIELGYAIDPRCDARSNCEVERASFRFRDASGAERVGAVVDVHLAPQG